MEARLGTIEGEFQGGEITVLVRDDVETWGAKVKDPEQELKKFVPSSDADAV